MSLNASTSDWAFYVTGIVLLLLGVAFIMLPLLARSGAFSNLKIPWILLYTYNKNGFFFATSPILIIVSVISIIVSIIRR
jgi:hypothetical protein